MEFKGKKYRDADDNVYGVEKASNGSFVVVRINSGGNRKAAKQFCAASHSETVQKLLDDVAVKEGWKEVAQ